MSRLSADPPCFRGGVGAREWGEVIGRGEGEVED